MHDPFAPLDIDRNADERAIKRAYAAKLRTTRPDEDPEGFQQLNEAYQTALAMLRHRLAREAMAEDGNGIDPEADAPTEPSSESREPAAAALQPNAEGERDSVDVDVGSDTETREGRGNADDAPQGEAITLDQFLDACLGAAGDGDPRVLDHWLRSQPVLWSLEHKAMIGHWLLRLMDARQPPMTERNFDMLAEFFGYNDLHAGYDPLALQRLRARLIESWRELQAQRRWQRPVGEPVPTSAYSFSSIAQAPLSSGQAPPQWTHRDEQLERTRREQAWRHRLTRQFAHLVEEPDRLRDLRLLMNPWHAVSVRRFLMNNPFGGLDDLPAEIRRDQIAYWISIADDRHWNRNRIFAAMARCIALALPALPLVLLTQAIDTPGEGILLPGTFATMSSVLGVLAMCWVGIASFKSWLYWQADYPPRSGLQRVARYSAVPLLVVASMVGMFFGSPSPISFVSGTLAGWTSLFQFRARLYEQRHGTRLDASHRFIAILAVLTLLHGMFYFGNGSNAENGAWATLTWVLSLVMWAVGTFGKRRT